MSTFEQQVQRYQDRVYGFAYYFLNNREAAEDVTQDVLLCFWENRGEVDPERVQAWLMQVTRNTCIDRLRRRKTQRKVMDVSTDALRRAASRRSSPAEDAEAADFRRHLQTALSQIDEPYRSVVILREVQNLKYKEISEALDMPLNTVKVYVHRGRKKLRHHLAEVLNYEVA